jgi:tetratricopeptide (TPR) repeat protein
MGRRNRTSQDDFNAVKSFEESIKSGEPVFLDVSVYETVVHFYLEHLKLNKALKAATMGYEQHPFSSEMMVLKATALLSKGFYDQAEELIDKAELYQPNDLDTILLRVQYLSLQEQYEEGKNYLEEKLLLADDEDRSELYVAMGGILQDWGKYEEAIEYYNNALEINPNLEEAIYDLSYCLEITEQQHDGLILFQQIIDREPYSFDAWFCLGILHFKLENYTKAKDAYEFAVAINDNFAAAHFNLGEVYVYEEDYERALEHFNKTLKIEGPSPDIYFSIAFCMERLAKYSKAIEFYQKASKINDFYDEAYYGIGRCLEAQDKSYEAVHFYTKAIKLDQHNPTYWLAKADAEYKTGNITSCLEAYQEACILDPLNPEVWKNWSFVHFESGNFVEAYDLILAGLEEIPDDADLHYRAVIYLINAGNYKEGFNYLENALILDFEKHHVLFEFFPRLETQKALFKIIDQYRK